MKKPPSNRPLRIICLFTLTFMVSQFLLRCILLHWVWSEVDVDTPTLLQAIAVGALYDLVVAGYGITAIFWLRLVVPKSWRHQRPDRVLMGGVTATVVILGVGFLVADWFFWDDIRARINSLAVDYLYFPDEVIGFLLSAYPMRLIAVVSALILLSVGWLAYRFVVPSDPDPRPRPLRYLHTGLATALSCLALLSVDTNLSDLSVNHYVNEVAKNGLYNFGYYMSHYDRDYAACFPVESEKSVARLLREELAEPHSSFTGKEPDDLLRIISPPGEEKRYNVILVIMESMSAEYMASFGNTDGITPNLDRLAGESLFYTNTFAAGMRTVRGIEAVTLSIPPSTALSIVRREHNDRLPVFGWQFCERGYDTRFVYNGYSRFDNMERYLQGNCFAILDRHSLWPSEVHFENSWGVCDEDMFTRVVSEADAAHARHQPFAYTLMTTSNHRPFTFPKGKIDPPPGGDERQASAKYADYAIGRLIDEAKKRPWFANTVFVFVADHTAMSGGKREITLDKFRIPLMFYAPSILTPEQSDKLCSQIDVAPTLLGILNFTYYSRFYGVDLRARSPQRALMATCDRLGFYDGKELVVLRPNGTAHSYSTDGDYLGTPSPATIHRAVSYYQHGASWRKWREADIPVIVK